MKKKDEFFEQLYRQYRLAIVAVFLRFGFDRERALELSQETFFRVYQHMDVWRQEGPWTYLQTTARRLALNEIRAAAAAKRAARVATLDDLPRDPPDGGPTALERLEEADQDRERRRRIRAAVAQLPPRLRAPLALRVQGLKYRDIATRLHLSLDTVKSRLHEAKKWLQTSSEAPPERLESDDDE